jgi:hypothetical protein
VQREPTLGGSGARARQGLAGLLAILLLLAATFSANPSLHRLLHQDGAASHLCLACSMVNGQLDLTEAGSIAAFLVLGLMIGLRLVGTPDLPHADYRLSPSRAPPSR